MISRRKLIQMGALLSSHSLWAGAATARPEVDWYMPDESAPHECTWMAFGASQRIWGKRLLPTVRRDLATLASTIAEFEPVRMLVRPAEMTLARSMVSNKVELIPFMINDLWMRDTGPTFVLSDAGGLKAAADLNFNGWGEKQAYQHDAKVAAQIASLSEVERLTTSLVLEGGCIEVDGEGTAIITESCVLNKNRNPGVSKAEFEARLMPLLGLDKIIWLPGMRGRDITDGHTDFYARFVRPGVVAAGYDPDPESYDHEVTLEHLDILRNATDAEGHKLKVEVLTAPEDLRGDPDEDFAAGYIGYYVCNGAVFMQNFGDKRADAKVKEQLQRLFPKREIVSLNMDGIAAGGGSIHCATQQEPLVEPKKHDAAVIG
ncbi:agmatine/peptidylarginine deiminase [Pleionea sp. CnH1-48]|uniref:agmatine deiminase family protein n=1 Tax=Pleionea sp. CnH1-48 TaxID=2954494 RepID=UPI002096D83E|nr:agmatine deiminase family protein [Pleionea sp. CnH1-48]MCO7224258.1 agmatine deiminase family protein [Pleionea sp. CnH1-48]